MSAMSRDITLAEGGGFEPPEACTSHAFEACALVRSATLPPASVTERGRGSGTGTDPAYRFPGPATMLKTGFMEARAPATPGEGKMLVDFWKVMASPPILGLFRARIHCVLI